MNCVGRVLDFEAGIAGQNITWKHEEGCAELGLGLPIQERSQDAGLSTLAHRKSPLLATPARSGDPRESIRSQDSVLPEAAMVIAVAAMAAVSARRIVEPSEAETQPSF